ncbi:MAG: hypothetical protein LBQ47_05995, partial [Endomicrobium sp.]|nr:hypothetical protein [Endomicrobium sp.]
AYKTLIPQYIQPIEYVQPLSDSVLSGRTFETGSKTDQTKVDLSVGKMMAIVNSEGKGFSIKKIKEDMEFSNGEFAQKYVNEIYDLIEESGIKLSQRRPILFIGDDLIDFGEAMGSCYEDTGSLGFSKKARSIIMVNREIFKETDEKALKAVLFMVILHENIHAENRIYLQENKTYMTSIEDEYLAYYVTQQALERVMPESREMIWSGLCAQTFKAMMDNAEIFIQTLNSVKKGFFDPYKFGYGLGDFKYTGILSMQKDFTQDSIMFLSMRTYKRDGDEYIAVINVQSNKISQILKFDRAAETGWVFQIENGAVANKVKVYIRKMPDLALGESADILLYDKDENKSVNLTIVNDNEEIVIKDLDEEKHKHIVIEELENGKSQILSPYPKVQVKSVKRSTSENQTQDEKLQLPLLTRIYKLFNITEKSRQNEITAKIELIFTAAAAFSPILRDIFIFLHGKQTKEDILKRRQGIENIKSAMIEGWKTALESSISKVSDRFAIIRLIQKYALAVKGAIDANIKEHVKYNSGDAKRIDVNCSFLQKEISLKDFDGAAIKENNGNVSVPVYIINKMPSDKENFKFKNTGVKIAGKSVWMSSQRNALIIFAQGAELAQIEEAVKGDNKKVCKELLNLIKKAAGAKLQGDISFDWVSITEQAGKTSFNYDDDGNIRVNISAQDSKYGGEISDFMTGVRNVRYADMMAAVENIYYFLDNIKTADDLSACLTDFQKIGNGQIALDYSVLKNNLSDLQIRDFFAAAHINGIKIIADLRNSGLSPDFSVYKEAGFDGALYNISKDVLSVYDFALASDRRASVVKDYANSGELVEKLRKTKDIKILNNSEITSKFASGDRSIIDRIRILKILKESALLGALKNDRYTKDFVKNAAYILAYENISALENISPEEFLRLLESKDLAALKKYLNLSDAHALMIYLENINANIEDKTEVLALQTAFLEGVLEKLLVYKTVISSIVNKDLEKTLGKALRLQMQQGKKAGPDISADEFKEQIKEKTAKQTSGMKKKDADKIFSQNLQFELSAKVKSLAEDAFVKKDPAALSAIIELIPAIAEVKFNMSVNKELANFDVRQIKSLLSAA